LESVTSGEVTSGEAPQGIVAFSGVTENDLLWASVCPSRPRRIFQALPTQTDKHHCCFNI